MEIKGQLIKGAKSTMEMKKVSFCYGGTQVLKSVSAVIEKGKITALLGPNGCGKTTLLHLMTKNLMQQQGEISLGGRSIKEIPLKEFAKKIAIVHQNNTAPADTPVKTLVSYGRTPHRSFYRQRSEEDERIIDWAMEMTNVVKLQNRAIGELSGGQRQRVWIAMALAQKSEILFLDEPTTYLDIRYQLQIMQLIRRLNRDFGITIIMVLHDINQAVYYSDQILGMKDGRVIVSGSTNEVICKEVLWEIYGVNLDIWQRSDRKFVLSVAEEGE